MKIYEVTHRINKDGKEIELLHQVISRDKFSAIEKAFRSIPKSHQKFVTTFEHKELRDLD